MSRVTSSNGTLLDSNRTTPLNTREGTRLRHKPISRGIARDLADDDAPHPGLDRAIWMPDALRIYRRAIRLPSVLDLVGCGRSHWYALLNKKSAAHDPTAPQPFKLGPSTHSPSVWWEHEVLEWLEARAQRRFH